MNKLFKSRKGSMTKTNILIMIIFFGILYITVSSLLLTWYFGKANEQLVSSGLSIKTVLGIPVSVAGNVTEISVTNPRAVDTANDILITRQIITYINIFIISFIIGIIALILLTGNPVVDTGS